MNVPGLLEACSADWCVIGSARTVAQAYDALSVVLCSDLDALTLRGYRDALNARERVATTALGGGIAIPHARMPMVGACRIALGHFPDGIAMPARDGEPVDLVAMLLTREDDHPGHLRLLAAVASRLADRSRRTAMRAAHTPAELFTAFAG